MRRVVDDVRIHAVLLLAACSTAPVPSAALDEPAPVTVSPVADALTLPEQTAAIDAWSHAHDPYAVAPLSPKSPTFAMPVIPGPTRTELAVERTPATRVTSMSGTIELLAVTHDGRAAITADVTSSVRLWPALDGTREPLVMTLPAPSLLAIARHGEAFAIASVDRIGQLQLVHATSTAEITRRQDLALSRPVVALYATRAGFLALRDDRVVTLLDLDGVMRAELAPDAGEYLASIAVRDGAALALIESAGAVRGRWIDLANASWGATTPALPFRDGDNVALSANHQRVAGRRTKGDAIATVDIATGKIVTTFRDIGDAARVVGFVTERAPLLLMAAQQGWLPDNDGEGIDGTSFVFAGDHLFFATDAAIGIRAPGETAYVGYQMSTITQLRPRSNGFLATDSRILAELDATFQTRAGLALADRTVGQIALIDGTLALGYSYGERQRGLYLVSTKGNESTLVAAAVNSFDYEPATRLLHYHSEGHDYIARFDARARAFGPAVSVSQSESDVIVLLDPARSRKGEEIAIIEPVASTYRVKSGTIDAGGFVLAREREISPSDEWWNGDGDPRTLVRDPRRRARSPDGTLTAELREHRLELRNGKNLAWSVPRAGALDLLWTPRGELVIYGPGMARIDLATGAMQDRRCGAWFGRWSEPPAAFGQPSLCAEL